MQPWRIVFMGTPDFAVPTLETLLAGPDEVVGVFTQPDKPVGRGLKMRATPVKQAVIDKNIPILQPKRLRNQQAVTELKNLQPDLVIVVAYGQILSDEVLALPKYGCVNVHASLLPRWRGAAPLHRALLAGDKKSGVTIMRMDAGLDTGPMLKMGELPLNGRMTGGELHDQLAKLGAGLLLETISGLKDGTIPDIQQPEAGVTYAAKLSREDEVIDWARSAIEIHRQIHALNPWPGAHTRLNKRSIKLFRCRLGEKNSLEKRTPGEIISFHKEGPEVLCGSGSLVLTELQPAGKKTMAAADWLRGNPPTIGTQLGAE